MRGESPRTTGHRLSTRGKSSTRSGITATMSPTKHAHPTVAPRNDQSRRVPQAAKHTRIGGTSVERLRSLRWPTFCATKPPAATSATHRPGDRDGHERLDPRLLDLAPEGEQEQRGRSGEGHESAHDRERSQVPDRPFQSRAGRDRPLDDGRVAAQRAPVERSRDKPGDEQCSQARHQQRLLANRLEPTSRETEERHRQDRGRHEQQRLEAELRRENDPAGRDDLVGPGRVRERPPEQEERRRDRQERDRLRHQEGRVVERRKGENGAATPSAHRADAT